MFIHKINIFTTNFPDKWEVGGKYVYPQDKDRIEYHHPRGFDDVFEHDSNIQFKALL